MAQLWRETAALAAKHDEACRLSKLDRRRRRDDDDNDDACRFSQRLRRDVYESESPKHGVSYVQFLHDISGPYAQVAIGHPRPATEKARGERNCALEYISTQLKLDLIVVDNDKSQDGEDTTLCVRFSSVAAARDWVSDFVRKHSDIGIMLGSVNDPLVQEFHFFRLNQRLYHILIYIIEGRLGRSTSDTWTFYPLMNDKARAALVSWLAGYDL